MRKTTSGFTMVEILVVIAVIGILATITFMGFGRYQADTRDSARSSQATILAEALEKYYEQNGEYPGCSALTGASATVTTSVLPGVQPQTLVTPKAPSGTTNSIQCTDLTSNSQPDFFAYVGDSNSTCLSGADCLIFQLKYVQESTGQIITIKSRHNVQIATLGTPSAPTVTASTPSTVTTYSWPTVACQAGATARYQYRYVINYTGGYTSVWYGPIAGLSSTLNTSDAGYTYTAQVQAQCYNANAVSAWSATGQGSYYRPGWSKIAANSWSVCALTFAGKAYCWGSGTSGSLGNGSNTDSSVPVAVTSTGVLSGKTLVAITNGNSPCVLDSLGKAYCWGYNPGYGTLGDGSTTDSWVPVAVTSTGVLSGKTLIAIAGGDFNTCAIDSLGKAYCWGAGVDGELGNGSNTNSLVPVAVTSTGVLSGKTLVAISFAGSHACALDSLGKAYCWGSNNFGELGNGSTTTSWVPVAVTSTGVLSGKTLVGVGGSGYPHTCALDSLGKAYCWGEGNNSALGNGSTTSSSVPVAVTSTGVLSGKTLIAIAAGGTYSNTCAIDSLGMAYCWGMGSYYGMLGNGSNTDSSVPVAVTSTGVLSGKTLSSVSVGHSFVFVVASDGTAYCWGYNGQGEFGNNTLTSSSVPVAAGLSP